MRHEVRVFAEEMERQLALNDHKGGWKACFLEWLGSEMSTHCSRLIAQAQAKSARTAVGKAVILDDAADVANFAMMIADVCGCLPERKDEQHVETAGGHLEVADLQRSRAAGDSGDDAGSGGEDKAQ